MGRRGDGFILKIEPIKACFKTPQTNSHKHKKAFFFSNKHLAIDNEFEKSLPLKYES